jgi:hypothetical protein
MEVLDFVGCVFQVRCRVLVRVVVISKPLNAVLELAIMLAYS